MPTPVSSARQCLAGDAAAALEAAVSAARRRAHAQTTSLHVVFALISTSSSSSAIAAAPSLLRDAVSRTRSSAYSPRLQFKALELCFGVALDRLPSSPHHHRNDDGDAASGGGDPPVSNSLMAAIKRSQAHQRRNPDTFHLYQQISPTAASSSSFAGVKVELQHLVLSILDDPVVSRVFGEAGFRSSDIRLAVLRPPPPILRFPRAARCPPLFLCNFAVRDDLAAGSGGSAAAGSRGFPFPLPSDGSDDNCRRIGEVLSRRTSRNPILVGVAAAEAADDFAEAVESRNWSVLPPEIRGLKFINLAPSSTVSVRSRIEELGREPEQPGAVASIGDLKGLVEGGEDGSWLVSELTRALELHSGRLWVMGWSASYETYMKFLSCYPLLDKDWDLQLLPMTSMKPAASGLIPRPQSLMESFVPFGGLFPAACESNGPLSKPNQLPVRCQQCDEKYKKELASILNGRSTLFEDQSQDSQPVLPGWLRNADTSRTNDELDLAKAEDDKSVLSSKVMDLQKKWNDNCRSLHRSFPVIEEDNPRRAPYISLPRVYDRERGSNEISDYPHATQNQNGCENSSKSISLPLVSELKDEDLISKLQVRLSKSEQLRPESFGSLQLGIHDDIVSPSSITSVTTDLVLGTTLYESPCKEGKTNSRTHTDHLEDLSGFNQPKVDEFSRRLPDYTQTHSGSKGTTSHVPFIDRRCLEPSIDPNSYKELFVGLFEKVGRQEGAIRAIAEAITRCRSGYGSRPRMRSRGDIWLNFVGSDRVGKKRVAAALAEVMFGSRENLICFDLNRRYDIGHPNTICYQEGLNEYDARFRGKTIVDHISGEISKNPWSVVFLENINEADNLLQTSLSHAIHTGKFSDSHGREFSINNTVFITTSMMVPSKNFSSGKDSSAGFSEEQILEAQRCQMRISVESGSEVIGDGRNVSLTFSLRHESKKKQVSPSPVFLSKRKLDDDLNEREAWHGSLGPSKRAHKRSNVFLDLNLPVGKQVNPTVDYSSSDESNAVSDDSGAWVEEFFNSVDETIDFDPFGFDALADHVLKEIEKSFRRMIGSECTLEIDRKVMEQILAATWLLEDTGELNHWLEQVLSRSFIELKHRYNLSARTAIRLVSCDGAFVAARASGILLPSRIAVE